MNSDNALIVPVRVTALMVNDWVRGTNFHRWTLRFETSDRRRHRSPEPDPLGDVTGGSQDMSKDETQNGVHVHWELPPALRSGDMAADGGTNAVAVPDRWLVVRYHERSGARRATGWLIQSDCLRPPDTAIGDSSPYLTENLEPKRIGRVLRLTDTLADPDQHVQRLTAAGPGISTFSVYQPYNLGVFSMHDTLADLPPDPPTWAAEPGLSYLVIGWYHQYQSDPLAPASDTDVPAGIARPATGPARLGCQPLPGPTLIAPFTRSVFAGSVLGVKWTRTPIQDGDDEAPKPGAVKITVAESSVEGLNAIAVELAQSDDEFRWDAEQLRRLEALQYGLLHQYDEPDGKAAVQRHAFEHRFEPVAGGHKWDFVTPPTDNGRSTPDTAPQPIRPLPKRQQEWLDQANWDQADHDQRRRRLSRRHAELYELWWYQQELRLIADSLWSVPDSEKVGQKFGELSESVADALNPETPGSTAWAAAAEQKTLDADDRVPRGDTAQQLQQAIDAKIEQLTREWGFAPQGVLTRLPRPSFADAMEPVVLLRGARAERLAADAGPLHCRQHTQLLIATHTVSGLQPAEPPGWEKPFVPPHLRGTVKGLLTEFAVLDADPKPTILTFGDDPNSVNCHNDRAVALRQQTAQWKQPWAPLYLLWRAEYYEIPYHDRRAGHTDERNWHFDGTVNMYIWHGEGHVDTGKPLNAHVLKGRIVLSPHAVLNLSERLGRLSQEAPGQHPEFVAAAERLRQRLVDPVGGDDVISQAMDSFAEQLTGREARLRLRPPDPIDSLVARRHGYAPRYLGYVERDLDDEQPAEDWVVAPGCQQIRAGQFRFVELVIVDRFGRGVEVVNKHQPWKASLSRAATVIPDDRPGAENAGKADAVVVRDEGWQHLVHLRPRLPQPARLNFEAVSPADDHKAANDASGVQPIAAWVVANHHDQGLLCYRVGGLLLGELLKDGDGDGLHWQPLDHTGDPGDPGGHLGRFLDGLTNAGGAKALTDLLKTLNTTRLTINPKHPKAGHATLRMLGRPLALLRARLVLEPDAGPVLPLKPSQLTAPKPPPPDYLAYTWPVLLGSTSSFDDGLVGYFVDSVDGCDYRRFYSVLDKEELDDLDLSTSYVSDRVSGANLALSLSDPAPRYLTLLADPWAAIHVTTFIQPTLALRLDPHHVADALARMEAVFHVGPALGTLRAAPTPSEEHNRGANNDHEATLTAFSLPIPLVEDGQWSWDGDTPTITATDTTAHMTPEAPSHLRTGLLRLQRSLAGHGDGDADQ